jgi:hypothetical protein
MVIVVGEPVGTVSGLDILPGLKVRDSSYYPELDSQVPDVPGVAAVVPQHRFLRGGGAEPVPSHANILSNTTDISGEVKRRFFPGLKAGVSTPRFR